METAKASWRGLFGPLPAEHGPEPLRVEGTLPPALRGHLYRNGPATTALSGAPLRHWFDGDGVICAARFEGGDAMGAMRRVQTPWLQAEAQAGRRLYRNYAELGQGWRRWLALPRNPANISVLPWQGRLYALWEFGRAVELDPLSLELRDPKALSTLGPTFSAHPHAVEGRIYNFGLRQAPQPAIDLYCLGDRPEVIARLPLPWPTLFHDFIATRRHLVFFVPPVRLDLWALLSGRLPFQDCLRWEPERGTQVLVVDLACPDRPRRLEIPPTFLWHFVQAWEEGEDIVVDSIRYDDFATNAWFGQAPWSESAPPPARLMRSRIGARGVEEQLLCARSLEFPSVDPREAGGPTSAAWCLELRQGCPRLCRISPDGAISPLDLGPQVAPTEPLIAPDAEGRPWLLSQLYDGDRDQSCIAIFDPARWGEAPVAKAWFGHRLPFTFHGAWSPC